MHTAKISVLAVTAAATFVLSAEPSVAAGGPAFGQHVSDCAHTMQYSGTHNPGTHQGAEGWDGSACMP